jgi:GNAT superfamily N-acetyltransferase
LHFPHPKNPKIKRVSRLVVLPDYQGIGIGLKLLNQVGDFFIKQGFDFRIATSTPALINSLKFNGWLLQNIGKTKATKSLVAFNATRSSKKNILSFKYKRQ